MVKLKVGILFGGKSSEHEVSLLSAKNVINSIDKNKYDVFLIAIDKEGIWHLKDAASCLLNADDPRKICLDAQSNSLAFVPGQKDSLVALSSGSMKDRLDVVFPVLHGLNGEDGTVQGLLRLAGIPFVGSDVLGSAIGMDKDVMKRLLRDACLPIAKFITVTRQAFSNYSFELLVKELGVPFFVKPCNGGSSVGVGKIKGRSDFLEKVELAFRYDSKIVFEEFIDGRELECSVLGNEHPVVSIPGEVVYKDEFYTYEEKYMENGVDFLIPAPILKMECEQVQELAGKAYKVLCCEGLARVDFFLTKDSKVIINEINTIPGFTGTSMYPKLWEHSGVPLEAVIDRLIELALEKKSESAY